jgi:hypothetical protein
MAQMPDHELETAIFWQLARELSLRTDDLRTAFVDAGVVDEGGRLRRGVIAIATSLRDVDAHAESIVQAGFAPHGIDVLPAAVARCMSTEPSAEPQFVLVLEQCTTLLMIVRGGRPTFVRTIEGGQSALMRQARTSAHDERLEPASLWTAFDGASSPDHAANVDPATACAQAVKSGCEIFASELAHEVNLCLHHLESSGAINQHPASGCVIGAGRHEEVFLRTLRGEISFVPIVDALAPRVGAMLNDIGPGSCVSAWLPAIGLALYDCAEQTGRAAA